MEMIGDVPAFSRRTHLPELFSRNRIWAAQRLSGDPVYFRRLCGLQSPRYLWIGCADSRVPANEIVGLAPGELFVHRNLANLAPCHDVNSMAVLQYAVEVLQVCHVIVCGHYGCGGVQTAWRIPTGKIYDAWIEPIRRVRAAHQAELDRLPDDDARWRRLCELNVTAQVRAVCETDIVAEAWANRQPLAVHGWIYDLRDGLLRDLNVTTSTPLA
jgi:carbonic anhydrase